MSVNPALHQPKPEVRVRCKRCGSEDCFRIHRSSLVKGLLGFLPLKHYRCAHCKRTFYSF